MQDKCGWGLLLHDARCLDRRHLLLSDLTLWMKTGDR